MKLDHIPAVQCLAEVNRVVLEVFAGVKNPARSAVAFVSPKLTVKATRQRRPDARDRRETILISIGIPNYYEQRIVKASLKAGVAFPMKSIYRKEYPERKKSPK